MRLRKTIALLLFFIMMAPALAGAQGMGGISVIRDTEIEETIRSWMIPIWRAAGLNPDAVHLILVGSPDVNAFVAGGSNIFVYTGMMSAAKSPGELLAVLAHETGHIAGGHLIQGREAMQRASYEAILATLLGIGVGVSGGGDAAGAIMVGGQGLAMSSYLAHSRVQESSADQAGLKYLEAAGDNPRGMLTFLTGMKDQELLPVSQQKAYIQTHPLTSDRLEAVQAGVARSKFADKPYPAEWNEAYDRIRAKLAGFVTPERVGWLYSEKDTSTPALYARAIAAYRRSEKDKATSLIDQLIAREGSNPYFHELKGQMLRDFGNLAGAAVEYRRALAIKPDAALIRIDLAQVLVEMAGQGKTTLYDEALKNLDEARIKEPKVSDVQRLYATIYGRQGDEPQARYHLAEEAALQGRIKDAQQLLEGAMRGLKPGTRVYRQANDLKVFLDSQPKKDDKRGR